MSSSNVSSDLLIAPAQLNIYLGLLIYITGFIGSIGNLIVYRSRSLRIRACSIYLFWEALVDLIYLNSVLLTRILQKGFGISITSHSDVLCKIRQFASSYGNQLVVTFLALATLDRILLAQRSTAYRRWGNRLDLANKLVAVFSVLWILVLWHRLVWYSASSGSCEGQSGSYAYFDNLFSAIVTCLCPMIILTVLGVLIGRSIRNIIQQQIGRVTAFSESATANQSVIHKVDAQLTIMILMQIVVAMISFLPYAAQLLYSNITNDWSKSPLRVAWEHVISETINLLSYLLFSCPFYVTMVSFSGFRQQLLCSLGLKKQQTVNPSNTLETATGRLAKINTNAHSTVPN
ncbi:unnamed protein product [Rotaria socialis]|uniref:G-protein coupled receptors family 1 profile domain-containing protein n=3 Tax=Rotaria socialis TaxID=392032 RepID=A0A817NXQ8_9BILA|nr:unnamed protein product [Rotaria socialis]CAF3652111.1 unnamed protein product [Rotaria socialis]CAF4497698.1 unnamed protein product [Rotaria socialis]CAF4503429.1 unnamed protein product [Rotaria socialis]